MASTKEFKDFILDQLYMLTNIKCKPMMGEFLLYYNDILFGGIYDNRLLIKKTVSNSKYNLNLDIPYNNAKPMYIVEDLDNAEYLYELIKTTCKDLKEK